MALGWHHVPMDDQDAEDLLARLTEELRRVREAGLEPLQIEEQVAKLEGLAGLPVVMQRTSVRTSLGVAMAITDVVRESVQRLDRAIERDGVKPTPEVVLAQLVFRLHYRTVAVSTAEARRVAQEESGVEERQWRDKTERRALRLVAQSVLEVDRENEFTRWLPAMEAGADAPQTVGMYWLNLFRDHYFRMQAAAYALWVDVETALTQFREGIPTWEGHIQTAIFWNVEFSFMRRRFYLNHGPMWLSPTAEGSDALAENSERIEYHDAWYDDFMARLCRIYGELSVPDHDLFEDQLKALDLLEPLTSRISHWLHTCKCPLDAPEDRCEVHRVLKSCNLFAQTIENEFERILKWYRSERNSVDLNIKDLVLNFRSADVSIRALRNSAGAASLKVRNSLACSTGSAR